VLVVGAPSFPSSLKAKVPVDVSGCNLDELKGKNVVIVEDIIDTVRLSSLPPSLPPSLPAAEVLFDLIEHALILPPSLLHSLPPSGKYSSEARAPPPLPPSRLPMHPRALPVTPTLTLPSLPPSLPQGNTLQKLVPLLHSHHPASLRILALFQKRLLTSQRGREGGREGGKEGEAIPNLGGVGFSLPDKVSREEGGRECMWA